MTRDDAVPTRGILLRKSNLGIGQDLIELNHSRKSLKLRCGCLHVHHYMSIITCHVLIDSLANLVPAEGIRYGT